MMSNHFRPFSGKQGIPSNSLRGVRIKCFIATALLLYFLPSLLFGQAVTGSVLGTVTDQSGSNVAAAKVLLTETSTAATVSSRTNVEGYYVFPNLSPGTYRVTVEKTGFNAFVREGILLDANHTVRVDATLQPGTVTTKIEVTSKAPQLQTDRADVSTDITEQQLTEMPLSTDRNYMYLLGLAPGVQAPTRPSSQFFNPQNTLDFDVNHQGVGSDTIQIEGLGNDQNIGYQSIYVPSVEAIESVNLSTADYDAELGRVGGGVVNVQLHSGTNQWHGSAFEFFQNNFTSARNVFAYPTTTQPNPIAPLHYNLYGFTAGGPIRKNKVFVFGDYEQIRNHTGSIFVVTLPSAQWRQGNFAGAPTTIYDPATGNASTGIGRTAFAGNIIPSTNLSTPGALIVQKLLTNVPLPNLTGLTNNFDKAAVLMRTTNTYDIKTDWIPRAADHLTARFTWQGQLTAEPPLFNYAIGGPGYFSAQGRQVTVQPDIEYNHTFSPTLIAEVRVGFTRWNNQALQYDYLQKVADQYGVTGVNLSPYTSGAPTLDWGGNSTSGGGTTTQLIGYSNSLPWYRGENHYEVVNNWTKVHGTHMLKWGVDYRRAQEWILSASGGSPRGDFAYNQAPTSSGSDVASQGGIANSFAAMLLDMPTLINRVVIPILPALRETNVFAFVQDKWQVRRKLTLDLGVRWEDWPMVTPAHPGGFAQYDPTTNNIILAGLGPNPMNFGVHNNDRFQPRVGLAYRIDSNTVFRAGYGITTSPPNWWGNYVGYNYPVAQVNSFTQALAYGPAVGPSGSPIGLGTGLPAPAVAAFPSSGVISGTLPVLLATSFSNIFTPSFTVGYVQQWNAAVQRSLPGKFALTVAYVGNHSEGYGASLQLNNSPPGTGRNGQPLYQQFGKTAAVAVLVEGPGSRYGALQVKGDRRFSNGILLTTALTWSKTHICQLSQPLNLQPQRCGRAGDDQTWAFVSSFIYQLPFGPEKKWVRSGLASKVVGNWQLNGIFADYTGAPLSFSASASSLNSVGASQVPNCLYKPQIYGHAGPGQLWFDTKAFAQPASGTYGNCGINLLDGPSLFNLNASIFRQFSLREGLKGELRMETFNTTNTAHFGAPNGSFGGTTFGQVTSASSDQRTLQFGFKLSF